MTLLHQQATKGRKTDYLRCYSVSWPFSLGRICATDGGAIYGQVKRVEWRRICLDTWGVEPPGAACTFWSLCHLRFLTAASRQVHFHAKARVPTRLQAHLVPWYLVKKMGTSRMPCPDCAKQGAMPSQTHLVGINLK